MDLKLNKQVSGAIRQQKRWAAAEELVTRKRTPADFKAREVEYDGDISLAMIRLVKNTER